MKNRTSLTLLEMLIMIIFASWSAIRTATNVPQILDCSFSPTLTSLIVLSLFKNCFIYNIRNINSSDTRRSLCSDFLLCKCFSVQLTGGILRY